MDRKQIESFIELHSPNSSVILADGLDEAFIGLELENEPPRAVYSIDKCIDVLAQEMTLKDADEYFWFNVAGVAGEGVPLYINTPDEDTSPYE
tara:strand:- start:111 stop:389 length:279 start_codon:yes stop_codon:yes gene_type:complete